MLTKEQEKAIDEIELTDLNRRIALKELCSIECELGQSCAFGKSEAYCIIASIESERYYLSRFEKEQSCQK